MFKKLENGLVFNTDDIKRVRPIIEQECYYSTSCGHSYKDVKRYVLDLKDKSFYITKKDYEELSEFLTNEEKEDYKLRNEKAIEHLKEVMKDEKEYEEDYIYNKYLLDILQGVDKE